MIVGTVLVGHAVSDVGQFVVVGQAIVAVVAVVVVGQEEEVVVESHDVIVVAVIVAGGSALVVAVTARAVLEVELVESEVLPYQAAKPHHLFVCVPLQHCDLHQVMEGAHSNPH